MTVSVPVAVARALRVGGDGSGADDDLNASAAESDCREDRFEAESEREDSRDAAD